jgi:citrate lyase subunit beta/citryl-CoA lyase
MLAALPQAAVMLPKADAASIAHTVASLPGRPVIALVETVKGYRELTQVAGTPGVVRIAFGSIDFGTETGITDIGEAMTVIRTRIVLESCFAGLAPPIDGVSVSIDDRDTIHHDATRSRQFGFGGKLCIHPRQVPVVNAAFRPSASEIDWARRVLAAMEASQGGATTVDGKMIDKPVVDQARRVLSEMGSLPIEGRLP